MTTSGESAILAALAALAEALTESRAAGPRPQHTWMKFGGHHLRGDLTPFLPWLALGEWMHIGGKTSFGLGRYTIEPPRQG